jgi:formate dehydrogenase alpha subunit
LKVRDGEVVATLPGVGGPGEGKLCIKGWSSHEFVHHPERLRRPLIRRGGRLQAADWGEALRLVAERMMEIVRRHGGDSLAFLSSAKATNEENYLLQKLARAVFGTNNVDHCARLCHASTVVGLIEAFGSGAMTNSVEDLEEAEAIFVIGSNTTEQHPLIARRIIRAVRRGCRLIVADPRAIPLTEYADIHVQHRPGTDVALLNAMMNVIISEDLHDEEFIKRRTEGFDRLRKVVSRYPPEEVEGVTGVPAELIREAARLYASAERASIVFSMGLTQHTTGVDNVHSVANLAMLTGNIGRPGTGVNPLRGHNNVQGACDMGALPDFLPGYKSVEDREARKPFEEEWGVELPVEPGLTSMEMVEACTDEIRAMYVMGENVILSHPDSNEVRRQLERLDFLAVSELFLSETAELADVVLPAASFVEKEGTFTATDRRVQLIRRAIPPIGESKPDWWIISQLARRLGRPMKAERPREVMDEIAGLVPLYRGISHKRLERGGVQWPCPKPDHPGTSILHVERFARGRGRFIPAEYRPPAEEPDEEYPYILTTGRVLFHWHTGTMSRRSPTLRRQLDRPYVEMNPRDAERLGIEDGDRVRVRSRRGEITLEAFITEDIKENVVFIPFHFSEAAANILTNPALDPKAKIPEYKACAVTIEKD